MSHQKVAAVRRVVAALNERDVDGYLACCTGDVELVPATAEITGTYTGAAGIRRFFADIRESVPDIEVQVEDAELVGGDVLASERGRASGRASGIAGDLEFTTLYEFEGDKISRISVFLDRATALEAVRSH